MHLDRAIHLFLGEYIASTRRAYGYTLNEMLAYIGPARPLTDIRPDHLIEYVQHLRKRPSLKSPASVNKHIKTIKTFFNWCVKTGFLEVSPARGLKRVRQASSVDRVKAMPDHVYEELLAYTRYHPRHHALVLFLGDTGCRIGGAAGLRWRDIDLKHRRAVVTEKGKPPRPVFFGDVCAQALASWRMRHPMRGDYVFSDDGRRIHNDNLGQMFRRACIRAGIGSWGPHSLRHRKGHQLADASVAPSLAAKALGHESIMTTLDYYYPDDWESVQQAISDLAKTTTHEPNEKLLSFGE